MRILFVLEHYHPYIGGAETLFRLLAEALAKHHEVRVLTTRFRPDLGAHEVYKGVAINRLNCRNRFLFSALALPAAVRHARWADVVHTTTYNAALPAWLAARMTGKKVVVTFHEVWGGLWTRLPFLSWPAARAFRTFERLLLALPFDRYVAVSAFTARALVQYGVREQTITRIPNGLDYAEFSDLRHQPPAKGFVATYFGRLGVSKGLDLLIPAFAAFQQRHPDARLQLIIPREPTNMLRAVNGLLSAHRMADRVVVLHELPWAELKQVVAHSSCVVIPSYSEGFCFVAAEAAAIGVPIVHANRGALPETVSGRHIPMTDQTTEALVVALDLAYAGSWRITPLRKFTLTDSVERYERFYRTLTSKEPGPEGPTNR